MPLRARTCPCASPMNSFVLTAQSRTSPSSCELSVLKVKGQRGQGCAPGSPRDSGGFGSSSNCRMDFAPCRRDVPRQSAPVSPPPMMMTCLSFALRSKPGSTGRPPTRRFCCGRNCIAKWMPSRSRPGIGRSRGASAPVAITMASKSASSFFPSMSTPMCTPVRKLTPSSSICFTRRSTRCFSILKSGIPRTSSPPGISFFSNTVTVWPARLSCCAAARPAGPEPMTATLRPVRICGDSGSIQPSSQPRSAMAFSMLLIVTGSSLMPRTQAASQGAGQMRPVNSGKLLVECSWRSASFQRSWYTRSFQSGMMLFSGHPVWQNGMPQSMQRAPWVLRTCSSAGM